MTARDASGVPTELRELLGLLAELAHTPRPADWRDGYDRFREVQMHRRALLEVRLITLADELEINDKYPSVAAERLASHCERAVQTCRERLAEPLGYEPEPGQDGAK